MQHKIDTTARNLCLLPGWRYTPATTAEAIETIASALYDHRSKKEDESTLVHAEEASGGCIRDVIITISNNADLMDDVIDIANRKGEGQPDYAFVQGPNDVTIEYVNNPDLGVWGICISSVVR